MLRTLPIGKVWYVRNVTHLGGGRCRDWMTALISHGLLLVRRSFWPTGLWLISSVTLLRIAELILVVGFVTSRSTELLRRVHQDNMDQLNALIEGKIVGALHSSAVSQLLTCVLGLQRPASRRPDLPAPSHHLRHHRLPRRLCYTEYRIYSRNYGRRHPRHTPRTSLSPSPLTPRSLYRPGASSDKIQ